MKLIQASGGCVHECGQGFQVDFASYYLFANNAYTSESSEALTIMWATPQHLTSIVVHMRQDAGRLLETENLFET